MSPAPRPASRGAHHSAWLRVLVLLLALLVAACPAYAEAHTGPTATVSGESTAVEYEALDAALRPPARFAHRAAVPPRPALPSPPGPAHAARRRVPVPPGPSLDPRPLRSEVLRC
ncbi:MULTISPECIES: hypothetical protein [unclassified Streptomyces]|uniref:hypothetical protein n=1 Tax=unclassified Streptomyces TaxID=2593676 RepID=UPI0004BE5ACA|nr:MULTISPECIES: hypothetical protein [unclassified Streptomyces]